jgi:hypothetical protein
VAAEVEETETHIPMWDIKERIPIVPQVCDVDMPQIKGGTEADPDKSKRRMLSKLALSVQRAKLPKVRLEKKKPAGRLIIRVGEMRERKKERMRERLRRMKRL